MQSQSSLLRLAIIADDLTGAADSGAPFARRGLSTVVVIDTAALGRLPKAAALVLNTDSRDRGPAEAAKSVTQVARLVRRMGARVVYKKIDSLFRGNVGAEIAAAMEATGVSECLLAPAFPEQGRTTEGGRCVVHGRPLGNGTIEDLLDATGAEGLDVAFTDLQEVKSLRGEDSPEARWPRRILVADAVKQGQLVDLAATVLIGRPRERPLLLAGSGGFASAIADVMARDDDEALWVSSAEATHTPARSPGSYGILVVSGSRSSEAARQVERLRGATGAPVVTPVGPPEVSVAGTRRALATIAAGGVAVVATDPGPTLAGASDRVAAIATEFLSAGARPRILFVGGETATSTLRLFEARHIVLLGEIEPGVAFGRVPESRFGPLDIATKAGAFGDPETLLRVVESLSLG